MQRFVDQVAIVTGAARGIGQGIARRLAQEGAKVVLIDLLQEQLESTVKQMQEEGLNVEYACIDICNEQAVSESLNKIAVENGSIDIMINSAGIVGPTATKITDYAFDDFQKLIQVNLYGSFLMTKYAIVHMRKNNYGRILLISSIAGKEGNPGMVGYAASKAAVIGLVKGIAKEFADTGITVNGLAPAVIATPMNLDTDPQMLSYMASKIPMGRLGTVEEMASIAAWIVSKEASFNTGFIFDLSGGRATY